MNDDAIQDLKQFISATISQQTVNLATKDDIASLDKKLSSKIEDLSNSVAEALESTNEATDSQLKSHDTRITRLEQKAA
ncbi:MAG: hypothetical protein M3Q79_01980 [bacterium]|nr:hypothetical protein [bacterium]